MEPVHTGSCRRRAGWHGLLRDDYTADLWQPTCPCCELPPSCPVCVALVRRRFDLEDPSDEEPGTEEPAAGTEVPAKPASSEPPSSPLAPKKRKANSDDEGSCSSAVSPEQGTPAAAAGSCSSAVSPAQGTPAAVPAVSDQDAQGRFAWQRSSSRSLESELECMLAKFEPGESFLGAEGELPLLPATQAWRQASHVPTLWFCEEKASPLPRDWLELHHDQDFSYTVDKERAFQVIEGAFEHSGEILLDWGELTTQCPAPRGYAWMKLEQARADWVHANRTDDLPNRDNKPNHRLVSVECLPMFRPSYRSFRI